MKPYGMKRVGSPGCLCQLCRSRGHKKGHGLDEIREVHKKSARQMARKEIKFFCNTSTISH